MDERRSDEETSGTPTAGDENPVGGDATTEEQLEADNAVEQDTLETLDPDNPPA